MEKGIIKEFNRIKSSCSTDFDVVLNYDNTRKDFKKIDGINEHLFDVEIIKKNVDYPFKEIEKQPWTYKKSPLWCNTEISLVYFYLKKPNYKNYWVVEYDVRFSGEWIDFFNFFSESDSDIISAYTLRYKENPDWFMWQRTNKDIKNEDKVHMFIPVFRLSARALKLLSIRYSQGYYGFCEVIIPTLLNIGGYKLEGLGDFCDKSYFNWEKIQDCVGKEKNKLYHPVKKISFKNRLKNKYLNLYAKYNFLSVFKRHFK